MITPDGLSLYFPKDSTMRARLDDYVRAMQTASGIRPSKNAILLSLLEAGLEAVRPSGEGKIR